MNILKKYLTIMLLLGLTCPATACNSSSSSDPKTPKNPSGTTILRPTARHVW